MSSISIKLPHAMITIIPPLFHAPPALIDVLNAHPITSANNVTLRLIEQQLVSTTAYWKIHAQIVNQIVFNAWMQLFA